MTPTNQHHEIALTLLSGIGSKRARILVNHFTELEEIFKEKKLNLAKIPGVNPEYLTYKLRKSALETADQVLLSLQRLNAQTMFFTDSNYPRRLKQCEDAPLLLYATGPVNWNPERVVSIVGTRHATEYGKQLTTDFVNALVPLGATIISGMAYGIDVCAHQAAVTCGLPTYGVLGHGLGIVYPAAHRKIASEMQEEGALITEFLPEMKPEPAYFPMRNRIVAGLADATIVVESGGSGGSLITANLANDYNRDVFAFPGDVGRPYSIGCLKLIQQQKAHLITNASDFLSAMNWDKAPAITAPQRSLFVDLTPIQELIVEHLTAEKEMTLDNLGYLMERPVGQLAGQLLELELQGVVKALPGQRFRLI